MGAFLQLLFPRTHQRHLDSQTPIPAWTTKGKGRFINSQRRPLHASEEDEASRQGSNSPYPPRRAGSSYETTHPLGARGPYRPTALSWGDRARALQRTVGGPALRPPEHGRERDERLVGLQGYLFVSEVPLYCAVLGGSGASYEDLGQLGQDDPASFLSGPRSSDERYKARSAFSLLSGPRSMAESEMDDSSRDIGK